MKTFLSSLIILCFCFTATAQIEAPQPSPSAKMEQKVGLTDVTIEYSRPAMRGRTIFGDLVPYGKKWRTGANSNTKITFSDDVKIGGKELKKGEYAIYTVPNEGEWDVIFYSDASNWGLPEKWDDSKVALQANATTMEMPMNMETFTIVIDELKNNSGNLNFLWANTIAVLPFEVPTDAKTMASIERVMNGPTANDYFAAASYYHDSKKDMKKAHQWITKSAEMAGDDAFWILRRKSLIEAEMGMKDEAIATAKRSLASAEKANNADYVKMNKESIEEWSANK